MRIYRVSHFGALLSILILPPALAAQAPVPDYLVRVTLRDNSGDHRVFGRLTSVSPDSLILRVADTDSIIGIDRRMVLRIERRIEVSVGKAMIVGCLALGGTLALAGSQVHDLDSPGIEKVAAVLGSLVGCAVGALGGAAIGSLSRHYGWEEITLTPPSGSRPIGGATARPGSTWLWTHVHGYHPLHERLNNARKIVASRANRGAIA